MVDTSVTTLGVVRRKLRDSRDAAERALGRFVRTESWNGISSGEVVRIAGHTARGRHWRFRAHVTNTSNGASWVEVALVSGPAPNSRRSAFGRRNVDDETLEPPRVERIRSFAPELVSANRRRRRRVFDVEDMSGQQSLF